MKRLICVASCLLTFILIDILPVFSQEPGQKQVVRIGIVADGPAVPYEIPVITLFKNEITELLNQDFDIQFPDEKYVRGQWTVESISSALERLLNDDEVDIIITMGLMSSANAAQRTGLSKPVLAPWLIDAELQNIPYENGRSGIENLCYINKPLRSIKDMAAFYEVYPFKDPVYLIDTVVRDVSPGFEDYLTSINEELGATIHFVFTDINADETLDSIPRTADAVIYGPMFRWPTDEFNKLIEGINSKGLPSFTSFARDEVEKGVFSGFVSENYFILRARRTALNIQRILLGEEAGSIPVDIADKQHLIVNMETARKINIFPPFSVMTEAELLKENTKIVDRNLSLSAVVEEALRINPELISQIHAVNAGRKEINIARSNLLPRINASMLQTVIDKNRAESSFGQQAEKQLSGELVVSQLLYSEPAIANLSIQKEIQKTREEELMELQLDMARDAARAYLEVLNAKTIEQILKQNLLLTRENLEISQVRRSVGIAGPSEVYRWESEIALGRKNVIQSIALRNAAEIALNRLLHRPLEESFGTEDVSLDNPFLLSSDERYIEYTGDLRSFDIFRDFFVLIGIENSPELRSIDAAINFRERQVSSAKKAFWSPAISFQGAMRNVFNRNGAGTDIDLPPGFAPIKDYSWNIGLNASLALFEGTSKPAILSKAREELRQLEYKKHVVKDLIEQRIRSALHIAGASHAGIALSQAAANAANQNLDLVEDAYSRGLVSIVELLDAQSAKLQADLGEANVLYSSLMDIIEVHRAIGNMHIMSSEDSKNELYSRLDEYFRQIDK
ncbi:MAG: TolC family protein [bacterium]|nr:TolC family protein [bacterium]